MDSEICEEKPSKLSSMLGPGFRFHPTDEELVQYYLRRKVTGKGFRFDAISDVDVYRTEPWDLPHMSKMKTRDLEWYFFSFLDKKYGNGGRTNRATKKGYWKTTGKDRTVYHKNQVVGMKKTLVYHSGRPPKGVRSNWVMHEYRRAGSEVETYGQDAFVVCRVFQKSGAGPRNGEQYGAPLVDEDWDSDELELVHSDGTEEVEFGDTLPFKATVQHSDGAPEETTASFRPEKLLVSAGDQYCEAKTCDDLNIYDMDANSVPAVTLDSISECVSGNSDDLDFLLDESFLDSLDNLLNVDGFIEANDLSNPSETDLAAADMLDEYLTFFDANDNNPLYFKNDPTTMFGNEDFYSDQILLPQKETGDASEHAVLTSGHDAASSFDKPELAKYQPDCQHPFINQASQMLGSISAPPAFAAEFPSKDAVLRLNSVLKPPSPAPAIHLRSGTNRSSNKVHGNFNLVLSFGLSRGDDGSSSLESSVSIDPGKTLSSRCWLYLFFWVLAFSMGFRFVDYVCAN